MRYLFFVFVLLSSTNIVAQIGLNHFVDEIGLVYQSKQKIFEKETKRIIDNATLASGSFQDEMTEMYFPVYEVLTKKKYKNNFIHCPESVSQWLDSLFVFLNPKFLYLDEVIAVHRNGELEQYSRKYANRREWPKGIVNGSKPYESLVRIFQERHPSLVIYVCQQHIVLTLIDGVLSCFVRNNDGTFSETPFNSLYNKFKDYDCVDFMLMLNQTKPTPLIYVK